MGSDLFPAPPPRLSFPLRAPYHAPLDLISAALSKVSDSAFAIDFSHTINSGVVGQTRRWVRRAEGAMKGEAAEELLLRQLAAVRARLARGHQPRPLPHPSKSSIQQSQI